MTIPHSAVITLLDDLESLRRQHYVCDDSFYNCPASGKSGTTDTKCECGADAANATLNRIILALGAFIEPAMNFAVGPGSVDDERKALRQLLDAMPSLTPRATGLSHAMRILLAEINLHRAMIALRDRDKRTTL